MTELVFLKKKPTQFCIPGLSSEDESPADPMKPVVQTYLNQSPRASQDFVETGKSGNMTWLLVCDGHGTDKYINWLRTAIEWNMLVSEPDPVRRLCALYEKSAIYTKTHEYLSSGSTFSMARILETPKTGECLVECINVGDSSTMIFINDTLAYVNRGHTMQNPDEVSRLQSCSQIRYDVINRQTPKVLSENEITLVPSKSVRFIKKIESDIKIVSLVPTQSLGHLGITGIKAEKHTYHCYPTDKIRVLVCSDGVTDMLCMENETDLKLLCSLSAKEIGEMITSRWLQKWKYIDLRTKKCVGETAFQDGERDDISLAIWERKPLCSFVLHTVS